MKLKIKNCNLYNYLFKFFIAIILLKFSFSSEKCKINLDCNFNNLCINEQCIHKPILPITIKEVIGLVFILISSFLANASGIGGGGLYVPILMVCNGFDLKDSTPVSKLMIFGGATTAFIINLIYSKNPEKGVGPAADLTLVSYVVPFIVVGTQLGIMINIMFPHVVLIAIMICVLVFSTIKTFKKAFKLYKEESKKLNELNTSESSNDENNNDNQLQYGQINVYDEKTIVSIDNVSTNNENINNKNFNFNLVKDECINNSNEYNTKNVNKINSDVNKLVNYKQSIDSNKKINKSLTYVDNQTDNNSSNNNKLTELKRKKSSKYSNTNINIISNTNINDSIHADTNKTNCSAFK